MQLFALFGAPWPLESALASVSFVFFSSCTRRHTGVKNITISRRGPEFFYGDAEVANKPPILLAPVRFNYCFWAALYSIYLLLSLILCKSIEMEQRKLFIKLWLAMPIILHLHTLWNSLSKSKFNNNNNRYVVCLVIRITDVYLPYSLW